MHFDRKNAFSLRVYTANIYRFRSVFPIHTKTPKTADAQWWSVFLVLTNTIGLRSPRTPLLTVRTVFDRFSARWAKKYIRICALTKENTFMWTWPENYRGITTRINLVSRVSLSPGRERPWERGWTRIGFFFVLDSVFFVLLCEGLNLSKSWHEVIWLMSCRVSVN